MKDGRKLKPLRGIKAKTMPNGNVDSIVTRSSTIIEPVDRLDRIATAAYLRAEQRGFDPGHELDDWLAAEAEIDSALATGQAPPYCGDITDKKNVAPD